MLRIISRQLKEAWTGKIWLKADIFVDVTHHDQDNAEIQAQRMLQQCLQKNPNMRLFNVDVVEGTGQ